MSDGATTAGGYSVFVPLLLMVLLLTTVMGFETFQRMRTRDSLSAMIASQQAPLDEARQTRAQLDKLVFGTGRLARAGNQNAKAIEGELKRLGIATEPPPAPPR